MFCKLKINSKVRTLVLIDKLVDLIFEITKGLQFSTLFNNFFVLLLRFEHGKHFAMDCHYSPDWNKCEELLWQADITHTEADWCVGPVQRSELPCFICLWTDWASERYGNIIHYISAPERDRLQKNETNRIVWPRLLLSESIVKRSCIGWGNCVERRGVSESARRLWLSACLVAAVLRVAIWQAASPSTGGLRPRKIRWCSLKKSDKTVTNWW
jgi:hypothetical protein